MPTKPNPPTSFRLPLDLKRSLNVEADKSDRTLTSLVVSILRQWVVWKGKKK